MFSSGVLSSVFWIVGWTFPGPSELETVVGTIPRRLAAENPRRIRRILAGGRALLTLCPMEYHKRGW